MEISFDIMSAIESIASLMLEWNNGRFDLYKLRQFSAPVSVEVNLAFWACVVYSVIIMAC